MPTRSDGGPRRERERGLGREGKCTSSDQERHAILEFRMRDPAATKIVITVIIPHQPIL